MSINLGENKVSKKINFIYLPFTKQTQTVCLCKSPLSFIQLLKIEERVVNSKFFFSKVLNWKLMIDL